ncbi:MAG: hypothetical protein KGH71_00565 [Candidatus Micrarchaeota archaeon]|nr:hypothetical protein [Candidatus Micrarchaeota archaeon]
MRNPIYPIILSLFLLAMGTLNAQSTSQAVGACATNQFGVADLAPWYCTSVNQVIYGEWQQWLPVAFAVILLSFSIAAIIFAFGVAVKNQKVREFGVGEIYEATASAIIAGLFMMIAAVMLGVVPASFIGPTDPYVTSLNYISTTISQTNGLVTHLFATFSVASYFISFSLNVGGTVAAGTSDKTSTDSFSKDAIGAVKQFAGLFKKTNSLFAPAIDGLFIAPAQVLCVLLMGGLLTLHIEYYLLLFGMYAAIPVFLLPGIILRSFVPTRSLGGMFMGIAIAFFFLMPVMFSVAFYFTQQGVGSSLTTATAQITQYSQGVGAEQNSLTPSSPLVTTIQGIQSSMGAYWLAVLFYPAMIMALTYFSIITIADFVGGFAKGSGKFMSAL